MAFAFNIATLLGEERLREVRQFFMSNVMERHFPTGVVALRRRYLDAEGAEHDGVFAAKLEAPDEPRLLVAKSSQRIAGLWPFVLLPPTTKVQHNRTEAEYITQWKVV